MNIKSNNIIINEIIIMILRFSAVGGWAVLLPARPRAARGGGVLPDRGPREGPQPEGRIS